MLLNKCVTITVKGINGNVNLVTVEKLWENDSLKVAVTKGLVKSSSAESLRTERQGTQLLQITEFEELWAHEIPKWLLLLKTVENSTCHPLKLGKRCPCVYCSFTCFVVFFCRQCMWDQMLLHRIKNTSKIQSKQHSSTFPGFKRNPMWDTDGSREIIANIEDVQSEYPNTCSQFVLQVVIIRAPWNWGRIVHRSHTLH